MKGGIDSKGDETMTYFGAEFGFSIYVTWKALFNLTRIICADKKCAGETVFW